MSCYQRMANCVFGLVLVAAVLLAGLYFFGLPWLDNTLADAVRREFMLPPSATVAITRGSLLDTLEGEVERVYVDSKEARISGLNVDDIKFLAEGVSFDLPRMAVSNQAELTNVTSGELEFRVSQDAIAERWASDLLSMKLSDVEVILDDDQVEVEGFYDLMLTKVKVGATGELYADGTDRIKFKATQLSLGGADIGIEKLKAVFSALTPVIDLGQFKMTVAIDEIQMRGGYLYVTARSMTMEEKLALEEKRRKEQEEAGGGETEESGVKLRIPSLEEIKGIFTEEVKDDETAEGDEPPVEEAAPPAEEEEPPAGGAATGADETEQGQEGDGDAVDTE